MQIWSVKVIADESCTSNADSTKEYILHNIHIPYILRVHYKIRLLLLHMNTWHLGYYAYAACHSRPLSSASYVICCIAKRPHKQAGLHLTAIHRINMCRLCYAVITSAKAVAAGVSIQQKQFHHLTWADMAIAIIHLLTKLAIKSTCYQCCVGLCMVNQNPFDYHYDIHLDARSATRCFM